MSNWFSRNKTHPPSDELVQIRTERIAADRRLAQVRAQTASIESLSAEALARLKRNHFGESLQHSMERR